MRANSAERVLMFVIAFFSVSLLVGCSGLEKRPAYRGGYLYYPPALVNADRALDEARAAGKDKECPNEFNALKDQVDRAYDLYMACNDQGAIDMANDAAAKIKALCPRKPVAEVKPAPKPVPVPPPAPKPEPTPPPAPAAEPERAKITLEDIHFDFNKATLTKDARSILDRNIKVLQENPGIKVQIEGHACAHGTEKYNLALGERRANAVKEYLAKHDISADQMTTISYGETRPLCAEEPTPKNKNSECMKSNRRVHFEVIAK